VRAALPRTAAATPAALRERQLPRDAIHVRPGRTATAARRARRLLGMASAGVSAGVSAALRP
jgi:hypothetical protein